MNFQSRDRQKEKERLEVGVDVRVQLNDILLLLLRYLCGQLKIVMPMKEKVRKRREKNYIHSHLFPVRKNLVGPNIIATDVMNTL